MFKELKPQCMTDGKLRAGLHQAEFQHVLQCPQRVCSAAQLVSPIGRTAKIYPEAHSSLVLPALALLEPPLRFPFNIAGNCQHLLSVHLFTSRSLKQRKGFIVSFKVIKCCFCSASCPEPFMCHRLIQM